MRKETKHVLRQLAQEVKGLDMRPERPAVEVGSDLDKGITRAWNEGQEAKRKADEELSKVQRMDKDAIEYTAAKLADAGIKKWIAEHQDEVERHMAHIDQQADKDKRQVAAFLETMAKATDKLAEIDKTKKTVRILPFGDIDYHRAVNIAYLELWQLVAGGQSNYEPRKHDDVWVQIFDELCADGMYHFYICVWSEDEWRKVNSPVSGSEKKDLMRRVVHIAAKQVTMQR